MVLIIEDEQVSGLRGDDLFDQFRSLRGVSEKLVNEELRKVRCETSPLYYTNPALS